LKGTQSLEDWKSLQSIDENHMKETSEEDSKDQRETKTIRTDQIIILEKP